VNIGIRCLLALKVGASNSIFHLLNLSLGTEVSTEAVLGELVGALLGVVTTTLDDLHDTALIGGEADGVADDGTNNLHTVGELAKTSGLLDSLKLGDNVTLVVTDGNTGGGSKELVLKELGALHLNCGRRMQ